ncbi:MAG: aminopeptidase, partial [Desulfobacterota bacterium]|nr:aminopeptidase [Thermodesulfobacteriota bacterium]
MLHEELKTHVHKLCCNIGERNYLCPDKLVGAAAYNEAYFKDYGYAVERQAYTVANMTFYNVIAEVRGSSRPEEIII